MNENINAACLIDTLVFYDLLLSAPFSTMCHCFSWVRCYQRHNANVYLSAYWGATVKIRCKGNSAYDVGVVKGGNYIIFITPFCFTTYQWLTYIKIMSTIDELSYWLDVMLLYNFPALWLVKKSCTVPLQLKL